MKTNKYLYLICSPNKWYGDGSKDNYKVNNLLLNPNYAIGIYKIYLCL